MTPEDLNPIICFSNPQEIPFSGIEVTSGDGHGYYLISVPVEIYTAALPYAGNYMLTPNGYYLIRVACSNNPNSSGRG